MIHGITIHNIYDRDLELKLRELKGPRRTARIVIDTIDNIQAAVPVVKMTKQYVEPLIQVQDSFGEKDLTDAELYKKAELLFQTFERDCRLWEISNETNGDWCSPNAAERARHIFAMMPEKAEALLTLFWQPGMIQWYWDNPIKTHYVGISFYPHTWSDVVTTAFDAITSDILNVNPDCEVMISETGLEEFSGPKTFRGEHKLISYLTNMKIENQKWVGGIFPWDTFQRS